MCDAEPHWNGLRAGSPRRARAIDGGDASPASVRSRVTESGYPLPACLSGGLCRLRWPGGR